MAKGKQKNFIKTDLRKMKYKEPKERQEKLFSSDAGITEEELNCGVVVDAEYREDGSLYFYVVKAYNGYPTSEDKSVVVPAHIVSTNGIGCWGKNGYKVFDPKQEDITSIMGESVRYMGEECISLNNNSLATRVELLCEIASCMTDCEKKELIQSNIKKMITKYVFKVIDAKNLSKRDREFLLDKVQVLFTCELQYMAQNFKDLKRVLQQKCNEHDRNNRVYTQKKSYVNVYE